MAFIVFAATDATNGTELWRTDGTAAGTIFLKDLNPGLAGSNAANFTRVGDKVFFSATTADGGSELWQTDGTPDGTVIVKDIVSGVVGSFPTNFVDVNGTLYFSADDGSGQELWKSDGTADGTERVKDIVPGPNGSYPDEMINASGTLYFTATGDAGTELWRTDSVAGAVLVKDTFPGAFASGTNSLTYLNGKVYYLATNGTHGFGLWATTGTDASEATDAERVSNDEFALAFDLMTAGGKLFFTVLGGQGRQLWTSDGETGGTHAVAAPGGATNLTAFNGFVYFTATDSGGSELWKSNGNAAIPVADIALGAASSSPANLEVVGDTLYFTATNGTDGVELWKTDGTTVELVRNINETAGDGSSPVKLTAAYHKLLFSADDGSTGLEPWSSNGTTSGTVLLKEIAPGTNVGAGIAPDWLTVVGSQLFFRGSDSTHGDELWATDGSALGTRLVKDIQPGSGDGSPFSIFDANGIAIFNATTIASGQEPWRSDGTEAGTRILLETGSGPDFGVTGSYTSTTTHVYFFELDPSAGYRLWTTDGTNSSVLYNSNVGLGSLTGIGNTLYFSAWDVDHGIELWKSDGTVAGTVRVADIHVGGYDNVNDRWFDSNPTGFTEMNGAVFFTADTDALGRELYRLDNDTVSLVRDIVAGPDGSSPSQLFNYNGLLLFDASEGDGSNSELWRSDGTEDGTFQLKDINTSAPGESSSPFNFILFKNEAYFIANDAADPSLNRELWKTDGTEPGTVLVKDINGSPTGGSNIRELTIYGDYLYFAADDGLNGLELWRTDGTTDGTELFANINLASGQGSAVNGSFDLTVFGDLLYFAADNGSDGPELWRTDGTADGTFAITDVVAPATSNPLGYGLLPNSAPTASAGGGSPNYTENTAAIVVDGGISVGDLDNTTLMGATVSITGNFAVGEDVLSFSDQNGIAGSYNATTGILTLDGEATLAQYQTALRSVTYANTSEAPSTSLRTVSFVASDGIDPSSPATKTVTVTAVNDPPTLAAPGLQTIDEDGTLVFSSGNSNPIQASDIDIGSGAGTATLDIADGALTLGSISGLTISGNGTSHVELSGTLADINTALSGLSYAPAANVNGSRQLSIAFNDQGNTGLDPALSGTDSSEEATALVAIEIESVNDAPVLLDAPAVVLGAVNANAGAPVNGVSAGTLISSLVDFAGSGGFDNVSDVDAGAVTGIALTGTDTGSGTWFYSINDGTTWNAVGAVSDSSALLLAADANTRLYFQPSAGFAGDISDAITFRAWDQSNGTNGGSLDVSTNGDATAFSTVSDTADMTVAAVNGPPVSIMTLGASITQNFDFLPASGSATWTNGSTLAGWYHARTGTGTTIVANNGADTAGNFYSYGTGTSSDRALGSIGSGGEATGDIFWGIALINDTGATITSLEIAYTGEQWRNSAAPAQTVSFSYVIGSPAVSGTLGEFQGAGVAVPSLDFTSLITGGAAAALDGNLADNRIATTFTITGLSIPNGTEIMLRWSDPNHSGADHGLAIDDFSVTAQGDAPPVLDLDANDSSSATGADYRVLYPTPGAGVAIADTDVSLGDPDDTNLESATIAITNAKPSDLLAVNGALPSGISIDGASTATSLILTGSASVAAYQTALQQVEFSNPLANPDLTPRDISVVVNDGTSPSNTATTQVQWTSKTEFAPPAQWTPASFGSDGTWRIGDFDGDGLDDIFRYVGGTSGADVFLSNGSAFTQDGGWTPAGFGSDNTWHIGDFDGDGSDDIFRYLPQQSGADMFLSNGSAFVHDASWTPAGFGSDNTWHIGDFDGNGMDDIFRYLGATSGADMFLSNGSAFVHDSSWTSATFGSDNTWHIGDFNGDGMDDIFRYVPGVSGADMFLSDGSAFVHDASWTGAGFGSDNTWHIGDFNGDGMDDIFRYLPGQSGADMFLSNGSAFVHDASWTQASAGVDNTWHIGDFDGDSTSDLLRILANGVDVII